MNIAKAPIIFDSTDGQELRINMISPYLKKYFADEGGDRRDGRTLKVVKLSLDGGFTCPNRDGSKGTGGCLFCSESGSGDMASSTCGADAIRDALTEQMALLSDKWPKEKYDLKYIAYFQSHTNTYAPVSVLREKFEAALQQPGIVGIAIATRTDCIPGDVLDLLEELNGRTFMWVEFGLQTINDETGRAMNLCHCLADYDDAVRRLQSRGIRVVTHLILGLPGESRQQMLDSVKYACRSVEGKRLFGLKLHMLNVVKGSGMADKYLDYVPFETMEEYIDLLIEAIELIPPEITMHRISGDAPRSTLISPEWSYRKRTILNKIHSEMRRRNTWQGKACD